MLRTLWDKTKYRQRRRHLEGVARDKACAGALSADVGGQRIGGGRAGVWGLKSVSATSDLLPHFVLPTFTDCGLAARSQASSEALPAKLSRAVPSCPSQASIIHSIGSSGFAEAARDTSLVSHTTYCGGRLGCVDELWLRAERLRSLSSSVPNASDVAALLRTLLLRS